MAKIKPWDYINSITNKDYQTDISGFSPYLTNKYFSASDSLIHLANGSVNQIGAHVLPKRAIYDYYYYVVPKRRMFLKFPKALKTTKDAQYVMEYYNVNERVAKDYLEILSKKELKTIKDYFEKRGVKK